MPKAEDKRRADILNKVVGAARKTLKKELAAKIEPFVRHFYANIPEQDLAGRKPNELFHRAYRIWKFGESRANKKALVHVFNPTLREHGYESDHTVVDIINDDMPFLVDSITSEFGWQGLETRLLIHPMIKIRRNKAGKMGEVIEPGMADADSRKESIMHIEITHQSGKRLSEIKARLEQILRDVRASVEDWLPMRERMAQIIEDMHTSPKGYHLDEVSEAREFLRWIHDNNFTFLGFREYRPKGKGRSTGLMLDSTTGLGILRDPELSVFEEWGGDGSQAPEVRAFARHRDILLVTKTNHRSSIHRPVHMDAIGIKRLDEKGKLIGHWLFVGLFTSVAYNRIPSSIPLLRRRIQLTLERSGFTPNSHDGKTLMNILETYPRDELFQIDDDALFETTMGILHLLERPRTTLFIRRDELERYCSCLVYIPRDRYTTDLRQRIQEILAEELNGRIAAFFTQLGDSSLARCHIIVPMLNGKIPNYDHAAIEERLFQAARSWADHLGDALTERSGEEQARNVLRRWADAFDSSYQERYNPDEIIQDIGVLENAITSGEIGFNLYRAQGSTGNALRFKIYQPDGALALSDVLPIFEDMGFKVIDEMGPHPVDLKDAGGGKMVMHNFGLETRDGSQVNLAAIRNNFHDTFRRVWRGDTESDGFNALVARSGLTWREVVVLRAYCKYLRQAGIAFSQDYMERTMSANAGVAKDLVALFMCRMDPATVKGADQRAGRIRRKIARALDAIASADEDRILRRYLNLIENTTRTNYFQPAEDGSNKAYLSFKLNSQMIDELPLPKPFREIFVFSPRVEGIHLRFGYVARGGLRWSDRREDFRTEILGLVKAQQVKNAVIVPVGSKGGFVVKRPPTEGGRDAFLAEGIACYKILIAGLLDLTDNIKGPKIIPAKSVVRHDDDDPYLVVAADKGTATFSDIANGVSIEYGHWLGDAFASGGSQGYDHKKMGITARGGWESVKRHFREMGKNIQSEDFTVVGVGDMAGDVFGNGMLLSKHIQLLAAFNHMHIFVDPNPDSAKSWVERKRLFDTPGTSWADYNTKVLSKGGAIFDKNAKSLTLTKEIRERFGISKATVTPTELVGTILRAQVELMWFGGIGTYVKSSAESHLDAGDRANDAVRVNGNELGCQVIGEGANLGCTQLGRIEFAMHGGRMNTDAIDNSAGVDSSDHEVNIKILLGAVTESGGLNEKQRNVLLASMTDEVGHLVLVHNYRQSQAITQIQSHSVLALDSQQRLMKMLERKDRLNRSVEFLPDDETIAERHLIKSGLCRPEISVLISYAKIWLYDELIASDMPDDPYLEEDLINYFPTPLRKKYVKEIRNHRLRREIIATRVTNALVDRAGDTFVSSFVEKTGLGAAAIARAYTIAVDVFQLTKLWAEVEALDNKVPAATQVALRNDINHLVDWVVLWFLHNGRAGLDIGSHVMEFQAGISEMAEGISKALPAHYVSDAHKRAKPYMDKGVPEALALRVAGLVNLYSGCDVVRLAARRKLPVLDVARTYFAVGTRFRLGRLRAATDTMDTESHWAQLAIAALVEEIYAHQLALTNLVLDHSGTKIETKKGVESWIAANQSAVAPTELLLAELWSTDVNDLSMIAVASRQIRTMTSSG